MTSLPTMIPKISFHFVRHGETDWNRAGRLQGWADIPLNARGEGQAESLAAILAQSGDRFGFASIAASPLLRARRTAEILNGSLGLEIHFLDDLREIDVGPMAGETANGWFPAWRAGTNRDGVETFDAFTHRIARGLRAALALPGPVLIVAHGGVVWALERLMGLPVGQEIANTTLVHFDPTGGAWRADILHGGLEGAA
ncbi:histidine phosphatase family protein [Dongia sp.]|uniref:histidine phosphatase family protein n=1 Tax=Dongia sp. TaxID=1977262 RepID=UPI0035B28896